MICEWDHIYCEHMLHATQVCFRCCNKHIWSILWVRVGNVKQQYEYIVDIMHLSREL